MTTSFSTISPPSAAPAGNRPRSELVHDEAFLALVGWTWQDRIVVFPAEHQLLGWTGCRVQGCGKATTMRDRVCPTCRERWRRAATGADLEHFVATTIRERRLAGRDLCAVDGCELPGVGARVLCQAHKKQHEITNVTLQEFLADPRVRPRPHFGRCAVASCPRDRAGDGQLCVAHRSQRQHLSRSPDFDEPSWLRTAPAIAEDNTVSLRGLSEQVVAELLRGLQGRTELGLKSDFASFRSLANSLLAMEAASLHDLGPGELPRGTRAMRATFIKILERLRLNPRTAWTLDRWAMDSLGHRGTLRFDRITQDWLLEAAKRWALDELPRRRGSGVTGSIQHDLYSLARLSASLTRHRDDHGQMPHALSRTDIVELLNWLAHLERTGTVSGRTRHTECADLAKVLRRMRAMGLTRNDGPLAGLPDDVTIDRHDIPAQPNNDGPGRDLPPEIVAALIAHLPALGASSSDVRVAIELIIDTGRRPSEITNLKLDCLTRDIDGKPVLIWDNSKSHRYGRRLPISETTAGIIVDQQERVRAHYQGIAADQLVLFPSRNRNPTGTTSISHNRLAKRHRDWVDTLPELTAPITVIDDTGRSIIKHLPFDKKQIQPYCWRHTYAQRHADAGVAVDVLCDLMDHQNMSTTQGYYRVSESRRRDAVDRVTTMQFDRHGNRIWRHTQALLDSERARRAVGEVAVPYGLCTEPSNVAAGGGDCPVRFRCVGCDHFRTDVSYLPDLEAYLADLLRNGERLRAATTADAWAITEAMPSDEEITRVRALIRRVKIDVDELDNQARTEIQAAVTAVRRARNGAVGLGMPRVRPEPIEIRQERSTS